MSGKPRDWLARLLAIATMLGTAGNAVVLYTDRQAADRADYSDLYRAAWEGLAGSPYALLVPGNPVQTTSERVALEQAKATVDEMLVRWPNDPLPHFLLGLYWARRGTSDEARAAFEEALHLDADHARSLCAMGRLLANGGDYEGSLKWYEKAASADPRLVVTYLDWGLALAKLGKLAEARSTLQRGIEIEDTFAPLHLNLGNVLLLDGLTVRALAEYQKAIEVDPSFLPAYANALSVSKRQHLQDDFEQVLALAKKNGVPIRDGVPAASE